MVVAGFFVWGKEGDEESENEFGGERGRLCGDMREDSGEGDFSVVNVEGHCQLKAVCVCLSLGMRIVITCIFGLQSAGKVSETQFSGFFVKYFIPTSRNQHEEFIPTK